MINKKKQLNTRERIERLIRLVEDAKALRYKKELVEGWDAELRVLVIEKEEEKARIKEINKGVKHEITI